MPIKTTQERVSLQDWFRTYLSRPALVLMGFAVIGLACWSIVEFRSIGIEQHAAIQQLGNSLTFAINQHDRSFAEHLLASHLSRGEVVEVAVCDGERLLIGFPQPGASCHGKVGLLNSTSKAEIKGSNSKYAVSTFSRQSVVLKFLFGLLICLATAGLIKRMISGMTRRFSEDVIAPIAANLRLSADESDSPVLIATVKELQQLYDAHRSSIVETRRLLEENAKQSRNAAMAFLVQTVAHDVRKPFSRLNAGLSVLSREAQKLDIASSINTRILDLQRTVECEVSCVEEMLTDIMDYGAISIAAPETVSLSKLARDLALQYKPQLVAKEIQLTEAVSAGVAILGSPRKLRRAFENLVENAIEAMPRKATLTITAEIVDDVARFSISNTDSVVPETIRERLFQPFVTSGKASGTGLGLAIVSRIVEQHLGRIWCDSDATSGTTFTMEFPKCVAIEDDSAATPLLSHQSDEIDESKVLTIALIEDDVWVQEDWESVEGLKVTSYPSPREFFALLNSSPEAINGIDAVVTDYYFDSDNDSEAQLSGADVLERVRSFSGSVPVLLASNANDETLSSRFSAAIGKKPLDALKMRGFLGRSCQVAGN